MDGTLPMQRAGFEGMGLGGVWRVGMADVHISGSDIVFPGLRMEMEECVGGKAGYRKLGGGGNTGGSWEYGNCVGS